jgi:hypothetical protein
MVSNTLVTQFLGLGDGLEQPRFNPVDGLIYMTGSDENVLYQFDPATDTLLGKLDVVDNCHPHGIGINPSTNQALLGCSTTVGQHVARWDFGQSRVVALSDQAGGTDAIIYNAAADRSFTGSGRYFRGSGIGVFAGDGSFVTMVGTTDLNAHQIAYDQTNHMLYTTMAASPGSIQLAGFPLPG